MSSPGLQGLRPWIIQRISAVFIALFFIYLSLVILFANPFTQADWALWVATPYNNILLGLFLIAVLWHAWIGMRDIVLDYVPNVVVRLTVLTIVGLIILASALVGFKALFMVAIL